MRPVSPCHPLAAAIDGRGVWPDVGQVLETKAERRELVSQEAELCSEVTVVMVLGQGGLHPHPPGGVPQVLPGQLPFQRPDPAEDLQALPHRHRLLARSRKQLAHRSPAAGRLGSLWKFTTI